MTNSTYNFKDIKASADQIYQALMNPRALEQWMAPGTMTGKVHHFEGVVGGGYEMSLFYQTTLQDAPGKTTANEDRFKVIFTELIPPKKVAANVKFESDNPVYQDEMLMEITLEESGDFTRVHFWFKNIPAGIRPEDNETGTALSLNKLAAYVEGSASAGES